MIEVLKQALTDAKRNERHNNVAETRYWLNQYKLIAEQAIAELESQEPVGEVDAIGLNDTDFHVSFKRSMPLGTKLYTHPPQRTEQEPVALPCCGYRDASAVKWNPLNDVVQCHNCGQTYTPSPQRTWQGLTQSDFNEIYDLFANKVSSDFIFEKMYSTIEAKLKERNI
jgi:hypothetical protein